jgi:ubiquinone/menaquinone biosynthesis C-methylase UbiE
VSHANDAQMLVLSALTSGPLHGYAVNAAIETMTGQRLGPGSLYGALARLESKALVEPVQGQGRRRPVRLTPEGRAVLEREAHSMARISEHVFEAAVPEKTRYLDRVAAMAAARSYKQVMLDLLDLRPGQTVVDLGCGPGTDLTALAVAVGPAGTVVGIDASPDMIDQARARTAELASVDARVADLQELPFDGSSVDRARTDRSLQHVPNPARVLAETRRVLRPGGLLIMGEPDWDSLAIDYPDVEVARGYTRHVADRIVRNGVIGRQLARLASEAGYTVTEVVPITSTFRDARDADQIFGLQRNTQRAVAAGYLPAGAARDWLRHLAAEPFFAAVTLYIVLAEVPRT